MNITQQQQKALSDNKEGTDPHRRLILMQLLAEKRVQESNHKEKPAFTKRRQSPSCIMFHTVKV